MAIKIGTRKLLLIIALCGFEVMYSAAPGKEMPAYAQSAAVWGTASAGFNYEPQGPLSPFGFHEYDSKAAKNMVKILKEKLQSLHDNLRAHKNLEKRLEIIDDFDKWSLGYMSFMVERREKYPSHDFSEVLAAITDADRVARSWRDLAQGKAATVDPVYKAIIRNYKELQK